MTPIIAIDMFSGAGGESTGFIQACHDLGLKYELTAINHWERAIETHALNHPEVNHMCESIEKIDPTKVVTGGRVNFLWASPECTHHSNARGGKPRSDQSRATAWLVLKWLSELYVERVIIENVPEFMTWGPLGVDGKPLQSKRGNIFKQFIKSIQSCGYRVDYRVLNAADYGDPTVRRRLFIQAVKGKKRILWPDQSHSDKESLFGFPKWRAAAEIIDWDIASKPIHERKIPLSAKTMVRINNGIRRYWGEHADPFITRYNGGEDRNHAISQPIPTLDTSNRYALISPLFVPQHSAGTVKPVSNPLSTITTTGAIGLVEPLLMEYYGNGQCKPVSRPVGTVTTKDRFALIEGKELGIGFRMLQPHELQLAQGFPKTYRFAGTKTDTVKQIGNAVPVGTAKALCKAALA